MDIIYPRKSLLRKRKTNWQICETIESIRKQAEVGLNLGSGEHNIEGLINVDAFNPKADLALSSLDLNTFEDSSVDLIESHHMIEHLSFEDFEKGLNEWHRVLKVGGVLLTTCPDLIDVCKVFLSTHFFGKEERNSYSLKMLYGSQEHEGMFHKSGYTARGLRKRLQQHGFKVEFTHTPYPIRPTPSLLCIARKLAR